MNSHESEHTKLTSLPTKAHQSARVRKFPLKMLPPYHNSTGIQMRFKFSPWNKTRYWLILVYNADLNKFDIELAHLKCATTYINQQIKTAVQNTESIFWRCFWHVAKNTSHSQVSTTVLASPESQQIIHIKCFRVFCFFFFYCKQSYRWAQHYTRHFQHSELLITSSALQTLEPCSFDFCLKTFLICSSPFSKAWHMLYRREKTHFYVLLSLLGHYIR